MSRVTFAFLAVGAASYALLQSAVVPVLPRIAKEVGTDQQSVTWVLTAFLLSATVFTPIMGRLGDIFGKNRLLVISLGLLSSGTLVAAAAPSLGIMIAARAMAGAGAGVVPLAFGILRDECTPEQMTGGVGKLSALLAGGAGVGMVIAGPVVDHLGYRWLFLLPGIASGIAAIGAALIIPASPVRSPGRLPLLPAVMLTAWLVPFLIAITRAPHWGWGSTQVLTLFGASAALMLAWWACETRVEVPLIDMGMMRSRGVWTTNLVGLTSVGALYGSYAFIPQFLQTPQTTGYGFGVGTTASSLLILPHPLMSFVGGFAAGTLTRRFGGRSLVIGGCLVSAGSMVLMAFRHASFVDVVVANGLMGLGLGVMFACLTPVIFAAVPPEQSGVAMGVNTNLRSLGGAVGAALLPAIIATRTAGAPLPAERDYTVAFLVVAALLACSAACACFVRSGRETGAVTAGPSATVGLRCEDSEQGAQF